MGLKTSVIIVLISVCGLPRLGDCTPSWDVKNNNNKPYDGTKVFAEQGSSFTFDWSYSTSGYTLRHGSWKFKTTTIASQLQGQAQEPTPSYDKRLSFPGGSASASIKITDLKYPADQGKYECDLGFKNLGSGDLRSLEDNVELIVIVPPAIVRHPSSSHDINEGDAIATLVCQANGNPLPKIKWSFKRDGSNEYVTLLESYNHYGYNISYPGRKDVGKYKCDAIITGGNIIKTASYEFQVNVKYKPVVTYITGNRTIAEGTTAVLECIAIGDPPVTDYKWYKGSKNVELQTSGKITINNDNLAKSKLTMTSISRADAGWYYCAGVNEKNEIGNLTGVHVSAIYAPTKVEILHIPKVTVNLTQAVTLRCESDGVPRSTMKWKFKDKDLNPNLQKIQGLYYEEVRIASMTRELAGEYRCTASNGYGTSYTIDILQVNYRPTKAYFGTGYPELGAILHTTAKLTCLSDGYPTSKYIIRKYNSGNSLIATYRDRDHILFNSVKLDDELYTYTCTPHNFLGEGPTSAKSRLTVLISPSFISGLNPAEKLTRTENQTLNYTCVADAKPAATIIWYIKGINVTETKKYLGRVDTTSEASPVNVKQFRTTSTLVLDPVTWRHDGNISCVASNDAGNYLAYTFLEVKHRPVVKDADILPKNKTVKNGMDVTFTCRAIGNPPTKSYRWRFNGRDLSEYSQFLVKRRVQSSDVGKYSCLGINDLGEGPWFTVDLFIKTPARITYHPTVSANISENAKLTCKAVGIPQPIIYWYRGNSKILDVGEYLYLYNLTWEDRGKYLCVAKNELDEDRQDVELVVQVKPNITSSQPIYTQVAGVVGESSSLQCDVLAVPEGEIWWTRENENVQLEPSDEQVTSIKNAKSSQVLSIRVKRIGEVYYCHAKNLLGYEKLKYTIRKHGPPDQPIDLIPRTIKVTGERIVNVNISWTPGYSGGVQQYFTILYKLFTAEGYTEIVLDTYATEYVIKDLKPLTKYSFQIVPRNSKGQGKGSKVVHYTTEASDVPPARGTFSVKRIEDGTMFKISWTMNENVTATYLHYREVTTSIRSRRSVESYNYGPWQKVVGAQGLSRNQTSFVVVNLDADKTYQFRIMFKVANEIGENKKMMVESEIIQPLVTPEKRTGLQKEELIAIIAACGGVLLILILILCLCCFVRRKKRYGDDTIRMSQTGSAPNLFSTYGDTGTRGTHRRSYATESVEDDPFIDAFVANEMKKKRRPENGVNHGYASQGIRTGMSQSVGQLDGRTSSYSSNGPQRDFSTLPPYHEPPSFEEAIRQSVKKSKYAALSTGDLTEEQRPPHGRSRARTPDSDTSDSEPPMNRRPKFKVKPMDPDNDKRYKSAPMLPMFESPNRPRPRDPSTMYARPQKKGPPPSYSAEDRNVLAPIDDGYEPRVTRRRPISDDVLELQEQPSYHRNDQLPDLPPSMPEFNRGRGPFKKEPIGETLPEPPSFLRDLSYDEDEPDGRYPRAFTEPRNRPKQPYLNIHGQLVRPSSPVRQPPHGSERAEPIYANDLPRSVAAEPEVPVERRGRQSHGSEEHKPGYVSSGFLV